MKVILPLLAHEFFSSIRHHSDILYELIEQFYFSKRKKDAMLVHNKSYSCWYTIYQFYIIPMWLRQRVIRLFSDLGYAQPPLTSGHHEKYQISSSGIDPASRSLF